MTQGPQLILCSGSLGSIPLAEKFRAAAAAGFDMVSVYGHEYHQAVADGSDLPALCSELGLRVAEVDGVAISQFPEASSGGPSDPLFDDALAIAVALSAYSITIVETGDYDAADASQFETAVEAFAQRCIRAGEHDILVHLEPFAWSSLGRTADAAAIAEAANQPNGGVLLDLWHHVRGPDQGVLDPAISMSRILGIQLADTLAEPWTNVRDECMTSRQLPGTGHADLAARLRSLSDRGSLPPIGIEVFGEVLEGLPAEAAAATARASVEATLSAIAR